MIVVGVELCCVGTEWRGRRAGGDVAFKAVEGGEKRGPGGRGVGMELEV